MRKLVILFSLIIFGCGGGGGDSTPPPAGNNGQILSTGSIAINNGSSVSTSLNVELSIVIPENATLMAVSDTPYFLNSDWQPVQENSSYTFSSDGECSIYLKFSNNSGQETNPTSDSILIVTNPLVTPIYPSGITYATKPTFDWSDSPLPNSRYNIQIASDQNFTNIVDESIDLVESNYTITSLLGNLSAYFWRIRIVDEGGYLWDWTSPTEFSVNLDSVNLLSPGNYQYTTKPVTFSWEANNIAEYYILTISTSPDLTDPSNVISDITDTNFQLTTLPPISSEIYYWSVTPVDNNGVSGVASEIWCFTTQAWSPVTSNASFVSLIELDPLAPSTMYVGTMNAGLYKTTDNGVNWDIMGLPSDSSITSFVIDPITTSTLFAFVWKGVDGAGVYKSTDGGTTWFFADDGLPVADNSRQFSALFMDPQTPTTLYIDYHYTDSSQGDSILYKTTDGGVTWNEVIINGPVVNRFDKIFVSPQDSSTLYASLNVSGSGMGFFKSIDAGSNWESINIWPNTIHTLVFHPVSTSIMYAGTNGGPYKSIDGGLNWISTPTQGPQGNQQSMGIAIDYNNPQIIYAAGTRGEIFRSIDGGDTWSFYMNTPDNNDVFQLEINPLTQTLYVRIIGDLYSWKL